MLATVPFRDAVYGYNFAHGAGALSASGGPAIGAKAMYFDGTTGASVVGGAGGAYGAGDFTWEGYFNIDAGASASNDQCVFSVQSVGWSIVRIGSTGTLRLLNSAFSTLIAGTSALAAGTTHKWSLTRVGFVTTLRVNGVAEGGTSARSESVNPNSSGIYVGCDFQGNRRVVGYVDEVAMYSTAIYSANYTPSFAEVPEGAANPNWANCELILHGNLADIASKARVDDPNSRLLYAQTWPMPAALSPNPESLRNIYYGGRGQIVGTVKRAEVPDNIPLARKVRLFRDRDAVCLGETWSDATTGNYVFTGIDPTERYSVVSYDYQGVFRAVIADNLLPDPL